jgi:hypothetical protein
MAEGFIRPNSVKILTYSNGYLHGKNAIFDVVYECEACSLVEGVVFSCVIKNISLAGLRATLNEPKSPDRPIVETRVNNPPNVRVLLEGEAEPPLTAAPLFKLTPVSSWKVAFMPLPRSSEPLKPKCVGAVHAPVPSKKVPLPLLALTTAASTAP